MRAKLLVTTLFGAMAALVRPGASQVPPSVSTSDVPIIASDSLRDVAFTATKDGRYVIYCNPTLLQRVGPRLATFLLAHEYGHVAAGHTGGAFLSNDSTLRGASGPSGTRGGLPRGAASGRRGPAAVDAAIAFFSRQGPVRYDNLHPTGSQRAANLLRCLPAPNVNDSIAAPTSHRHVESRPPTGHRVGLDN